jgi:hypothetical protein
MLSVDIHLATPFDLQPTFDRIFNCAIPWELAEKF